MYVPDVERGLRQCHHQPSSILPLFVPTYLKKGVAGGHTPVYFFKTK